MKKVDISVVICTYNRASILREALSHLVIQSTDDKFTYEIIIIDDLSTDNTYKVVSEITAQCSVPLRYIREEGNGVARARNRGIEESSGDWIAFIDDDEIAEVNWLKELLECAIETGSRVVGGAVRLSLPNCEPSQISPICRRELGEKVDRLRIEKCARKFFPGCGNMLVRTTVFETVGRFDESLKFGGEDVEFGSRVRRVGLESWFTPKALVIHHIPSYRLKKDYLFWSSVRGGENFAYRDYREWGVAKTGLSCLARIGKVLLITFPLLIWAYLRRDKKEILGQKCQLLRVMGYTQKTLFILLPWIFNRYMHNKRLTFRGERNTFGRNLLNEEIIKDDHSPNKPKFNCLI